MLGAIANTSKVDAVADRVIAVIAYRFIAALLDVRLIASPQEVHRELVGSGPRRRFPPAPSANSPVIVVTFERSLSAQRAQSS
jgi:hypothetical protein